MDRALSKTENNFTCPCFFISAVLLFIYKIKGTLPSAVVVASLGDPVVDALGDPVEPALGDPIVASLDSVVDSLTLLVALTLLDCVVPTGVVWLGDPLVTEVVGADVVDETVDGAVVAVDDSVVVAE